MMVDHPVQTECCVCIFVYTLPVSRLYNLCIFDIVLEIGFWERWIYDVFRKIKCDGEVDFSVIFAFFVTYLLESSKLNDKIFGGFVHLHFFLGEF